jgi:hypothetical protein
LHGEIDSLGRRVFKGDEGATLKSKVVPKNTDTAFEVRKGQRLRIGNRTSTMIE